jgi:hypothetical protein
MKGMKPTICDCPFTEWCEDTRQWLREQFRKEGHEKTVADCDFFKMIKAKENENGLP